MPDTTVALNTHDIVIPRSLRPKDGRFGSGPSKIRPEQLTALTDASRSVLGTSHRQDPVKNLIASIRDDLESLFDLDNGYEIILGNGGASTFWDVATFGLIENRVAHQVAGEFTHRFAEVTRAAPFLSRSYVDRSEPGRRPEARAYADVDAYAWAQNETSTGVTTPTRRPAGATRDQLTLVDGVSSAGAMPNDFTQSDVYYFSPQKAFSSDGGTWFAVMSPQAIERAYRLEATNARVGRWTPPSLSLTSAIENFRKNQTYNTPALTTLALMHEQTKWLLEHGGVPWAYGRARTNSNLVYDWSKSREGLSPFVQTDDDRSPVTAVVNMPEGLDVQELTRILRTNGIFDVDPYRTMGERQLRIACFPSIEHSDIEDLLRCVDWVIDKMKHGQHIH